MPKRRLTIEEQRAVSRRTLGRIAENMGKGTRVLLHPSNMLAGPCQACLRVAGELHTASTAPAPPFDGCSHPDQCACVWGVDTDRLFV